MDEDSELSMKDKILNEHDFKPEKCFHCKKNFFRNYDRIVCDECFFAKFPKDAIAQFFEHYLK